MAYPESHHPKKNRNVERAEYALKILNDYMKTQPGISEQDALSDLLTNFMHVSQQEMLDFQEALRSAEVNFSEESELAGDV